MSSGANYSSLPHPPRCSGLRRPRGASKPVGVVAPHYNLERVSYLVPVDGYTFCTLRRAPLHRLARSRFWENTPIVLNRAVPLVHTWNMLPLVGGRFVVSFELELPRYLGNPSAWQKRIGVRLLEGNRCRAVLALSDAARRLAVRKYGTTNPRIVEKLRLFRGAVLPSDAPVMREPGSGPLRLLFVGGDGLRKGLYPLVAAATAARVGGVEIEMTVVSSLAPGRSYVFGDMTPSADLLRQRIARLPWIRHHDSLPNAEIRKLMRTHDLFVLPSLDESLGWVVIEAGMEGLASVLTNVFAFPELVDDGVTGRLIPLELTEDQRWTGIFTTTTATRRAAMEHADATIERHLVKCFHELATRRELIRQWGEAARQHMHAMYHPDQAAAQLKTIYDAALSSPK